MLAEAISSLDTLASRVVPQFLKRQLLCWSRMMPFYDHEFLLMAYLGGDSFTLLFIYTTLSFPYEVVFSDLWVYQSFLEIPLLSPNLFRFSSESLFFFVPWFLGWPSSVLDLVFTWESWYSGIGLKVLQGVWFLLFVVLGTCAENLRWLAAITDPLEHLKKRLMLPERLWWMLKPWACWNASFYRWLVGWVVCHVLFQRTS